MVPDSCKFWIYTPTKTIDIYQNLNVLRNKIYVLSLNFVVFEWKLEMIRLKYDAMVMGAGPARARNIAPKSALQTNLTVSVRVRFFHYSLNCFYDFGVVA